MKNEEIFSKIYKNATWAIDSKEGSRSGAGSDTNSVSTYVNFVKEVITRYKITSITDIGHGDWNMWGDYRFEGIDYHGVDVSSGLSEALTKKYPLGNLNFHQADATSEEIKTSQLLMCKDVLQHLSDNDIESILNKLSNFDYLLICNDQIIKFSPTDLTLQLKNLITNLLKKRTTQKFKVNPLAAFFNNTSITSGSWHGINLNSQKYKQFFSEHILISCIQYPIKNRKGIVKTVSFYVKNEK